jgi:hypothetical protein
VALEFPARDRYVDGRDYSGNPLNERAFQVSLANWDEEVQAFPPDSAHQSFSNNQPNSYSLLQTEYLRTSGGPNERLQTQ